MVLFLTVLLYLEHAYGIITAVLFTCVVGIVWMQIVKDAIGA
jgi:hypothetical protein